MGGFDVELAALPAAKAEADRVHDQLQTALGDVTARVSALLSGGWSGPAATAYRQAFDEWSKGAQDVLKGLATMSQLIVATERAYSGSDTLSAAQMDRLGGAV